MASEELRARYRALKAKQSKGLAAKAKGNVQNRANADGRTRQILERLMAGEKLEDIAKSLGREPRSVKVSIDLYRKRHPDTPILAVGQP